MPANVDQPAARQETDPLPSVSYDFANKAIYVDLICSKGPDDARCKILAPTIALPGGSIWTIIWTLVPGPGSPSVFFEGEHGIKTPYPEGTHLPETVDISFSKGESEAKQWKWQVSFNREKPDDWKTDQFHYEIRAFETVNGKPRRVGFKYDPTILVTKDPIEGGYLT